MAGTPGQDAAATFDPLRPGLIRIAYRMLGSVADAKDMVQEAFLRWFDTDREAVREPEAFLRRVVTRLCLDQLKSARHRRETYTGPWLPEPVQSVRFNTIPEVRELDGIEECDHLDDDTVFHPHVPGVSVSIPLPVTSTPFGVEQRNYSITVRIDASDGRHKPVRHASVERFNDNIHEFLFAVIDARHRRIAHDCPPSIGSKEIKRTPRATSPRIKCSLNLRLVLHFNIFGPICPQHRFLQSANKEGE
jgi:hypothetical protein